MKWKYIVASDVEDIWQPGQQGNNIQEIWSEKKVEIYRTCIEPSVLFMCNPPISTATATQKGKGAKMLCLRSESAFLRFTFETNFNITFRPTST